MTDAPSVVPSGVVSLRRPGLVLRSGAGVKALGFATCLLLAACGGTRASELQSTTPPQDATRTQATPEQRLKGAQERLAASDYARAEREFRELLSAENGAAAELGLSEVLLVTGRYDEAAVKSRSAAQRDPALIRRAAVVGGEALRRLGRLDAAEALLAAVAPGPETRAIRLLLAEIRLESGRREQAEPLLHALIEDYNEDRITEEDAAGLALAARAAWLLRSPRDANTLFNAAERAESADPQLLLWRAELFLEKYDTGRAQEVLLEMLKLAPRHPQALTWLAQVRLDQALDFDEAERLARLSLTYNPQLAEAYFVLAGIALRDMELQRADSFLDTGLASNPRSLPLLSLRATVRFLADDAAGFEQAKRGVLSLNPEYSRLFAILGEYADWEHRYDEIVVLMREALSIDSEDATAHAQLGFNLIRGGNELEGVSALSRAFALDPYNVRVYNTLNLFDTVIPKAYVTVRHPHFVIRYHKADKDILERYVPKLLNEAFQSMTRGYGFEPETPVGVEIYAERESFAVRTSGLPRTAIQGVCFGKTLATMSPQNESFNLGMTLWHELSHVFHIQLSKSRVPRWFTEGLAEYETLVTRPEWAREHDAELFQMVQSGKLPALQNMSRAFTRAEELGDVATAYYASSRIVEMLAKRHGRAKMAEMLRLWGEGQRTDRVFSQALGSTLSQVDREVRAEIDKSLSRYRSQFVPLGRARSSAALQELIRKQPDDLELKVELALSSLRAGRTEASARGLDEVLKRDPKHAQARFLRAKLHAETADAGSAEKLLRQMLQDGQDGYAVDLELAQLARLRGDSASARAALELAHRKDPTQVEPLLLLAEIARAEDVPSEELLVLEKLAKLAEHSPIVHRRFMERLLEAKRYEDAVRAGEAALWVDVNGLRTHVLFAEALAHTGDSNRARFELESALLCPGEAAERADVHMRLAELALRMKRPAEARKHTTEAKRLDPANTPSEPQTP